MPRHVTSWILAGLLTALPADPQPSDPSRVAGTPHNLSISGPGAIKASAETQICVFCHTPHGASTVAPLWNRYETTTTFSLYPAGSSMQATPGQPNGSSRLCLSCHDGTSALGMVRSRPGAISLVGVNAQGRLPAGAANLGSSLADDHPISFIPSLVDPELVLPPAGHAVALDGQGQLQCRSCHDPHDNQFGDFLASSSAQGALCTTCHAKRDWASSRHGHPAEPAFQQLTEQACSSCHTSHSASTAPRLLRGSEETLCYACHDAARSNSWEVPSLANITTQFSKASRHPVTTASGVHDPGEGPLNSWPAPASFLPETSTSAPRHVECVDCHNPHSLLATDPAGGPNATLNNVWGITESGARISPVTHEYQICYKCHGDSANRPAGSTNKRLEFLSTNPSHHAVAGPATTTSVPSLISPWTVSSRLKCSDCHGSETTTGAQGPHGSTFAPLLKRNFFTGFGGTYTTARYALCFGCHNSSIVMSSSSWSRHNMHVANADKDNCKACHNSHGSQNSTHMVRFNTGFSYITPSSSGRLEFIDNGTRRGTCYVTCHGEDHNPETY